VKRAFAVLFSFKCRWLGARRVVVLAPSSFCESCQARAGDTAYHLVAMSSHDTFFRAVLLKLERCSCCELVRRWSAVLL
jgi:hypothetical protein